MSEVTSFMYHSGDSLTCSLLSAPSSLLPPLRTSEWSSLQALALIFPCCSTSPNFTLFTHFHLLKGAGPRKFSHPPPKPCLLHTAPASPTPQHPHQPREDEAESPSFVAYNNSVHRRHVFKEGLKKPEA